MLVFLNGQFLPEAQAVVPVNDRGFLLGDGLFETMRVIGGKPFRFAQHLERMTRGADFLKIKLPFTPKELEKFGAQLIEQNKISDAILRVTLTRGAGERGYSFNGECKPTVVMTLHAAPLLENQVEWNLVTSSFRIPAVDPLSSFKTTSKILHVMARAEAKEKGADETLLINTNGEVAETASGNLFWVYDEKICTVPTGRGVLPGITRDTIVKIAGQLGIPVAETIIPRELLYIADEVFFTGTAVEVTPIRSVDRIKVGEGRRGPITEKIQKRFFDIVDGVAADEFGWLTPVPGVREPVEA